MGSYQIFCLFFISELLSLFQVRFFAESWAEHSLQVAWCSSWALQGAFEWSFGCHWRQVLFVRLLYLYGLVRFAIEVAEPKIGDLRLSHIVIGWWIPEWILCWFNGGIDRGRFCKPGRSR